MSRTRRPYEWAPGRGGRRAGGTRAGRTGGGRWISEVAR